MNDTEMYRKFANDCVEGADNSFNPLTKGGLLQLAQFWLAKAERAEQTHLTGVPPRRIVHPRLAAYLQHGG